MVGGRRRQMVRSVGEQMVVGVVGVGEVGGVTGTRGATRMAHHCSWILSTVLSTVLSTASMCGEHGSLNLTLVRRNGAGSGVGIGMVSGGKSRGPLPSVHRPWVPIRGRRKVLAAGPTTATGVMGIMGVMGATRAARARGAGGVEMVVLAAAGTAEATMMVRLVRVEWVGMGLALFLC